MDSKSDILAFLRLEQQKALTATELYTIDAFVLAQFAYLPFGADIRGYNGPCINVCGLTIGEFCKFLLSETYKSIMSARFDKDAACNNDFIDFTRLMSQNNRYKNIRINGCSYENDKNSQFAAFCLNIGKDDALICYRGTDGTYDGWYEDFMMIDDDVEAQKAAYEYLKYYMDSSEYKKIHLTGHSKGGNLAVYAATKAFEEFDGRLGNVYNFDGPGFNQEFLDENAEVIKKAAMHMYAYLPENSVVGELLLGQKKIFADRLQYVEADEKVKFLCQHSLFTWIIENCDFVLGQQSVISKIINTTLDFIVKNTPSSNIKVAVELFFAAARAINGAKSDENIKLITKLTEDFIKSYLKA